MNRWESLLKGIEQTGKSAVADCFQRINEQIKSSLTSRVGADDFSAPPLARILVLMAIGISDEKRLLDKGGTKYNPVRWKELANEIQKFANELPDFTQAITCKTYSDDTISGFATLASRAAGSPVPYFYSTILLFVINSAEASKFATPFLELMIAREDRVFIANAASFIQDRMRIGFGPGKTSEVMSISQRYFVDKGLQLKLSNFADAFTVPNASRSVSRGFQVIIYRPMKKGADQFIKTFAAIYDRSDGYLDENGFTYSHFYKPPHQDGEMRFSRGKVLPLGDAVYLTGGQRPLSDLKGPIPFKSLKTICIRWSDIEKKHTVFPLLVLTTNYDGKVLVSRAAARLTPIDKSDDSGLGFTTVARFEEQLREDSERELNWISQNNNFDDKKREQLMEVFPLTRRTKNIKEVAKQILYLSNNDPHKDSGWCVPRGFRNKKTELTTDGLKGLVSDALGESGRDPFVDQDGTIFSLWDHPRFGPLRID